MAIDLPRYAQIKDKYCIAYLGLAEEYLIQLKLLRTLFEKEFPGISIYICTKDNVSILDSEERVIKYKELKETKDFFAFVREINYKTDNIHPVEELAIESGINNIKIPIKYKVTGSKCVIYPNGNYPTKNINEKQIKTILNMAHKAGYETEINGNLETAGWVIGVENRFIWEAAALGIKTTLIETGIGTNLYRKMFPQNEVISSI